MKTSRFHISLLLLGLLTLISPLTGHAETKSQFEASTKKERNLIREGNKAYADSDFTDALECYERALTLNPSSLTADYNKALALTHLRSEEDVANGNDAWLQADSIFEHVAKISSDPGLAEKSQYNRGNIAYGMGDFKKSIDMYKKALRINPSNVQTLQNLRLAQLQLQQQQQQQDQQDNGNDKDQDKQNDNSDKQQNDQQDQQQEKQDQQNQQQQQQQQEQQQKQELSGSAQQILQSMQNKENATRAKVKKGENGRPVRGRRTTDKPW